MSDDDLKRILEEVQNIKLSEWKCKEENLLAGAFTFSDCNKRGLLRPLINQYIADYFTLKDGEEKNGENPHEIKGTENGENGYVPEEEPVAVEHQPEVANDERKLNWSIGMDINSRKISTKEEILKCIDKVKEAETNLTDQHKIIEQKEKELH